MLRDCIRGPETRLVTKTVFLCVPAGESWTVITNPFLSDAYSPPLGLYWEPPCLVSKAVTPMVKAESELGP